MAKKWIKAMHMKKGALTKQAKRKHQTVAEFSRSKKGKSATTKRRINLARTLKKFNRKRRK